MSRFRRAESGTTFFFTVVAYHRRPILCDLLIRTALRDAVQAVRRTRPFSIDGWILLPDHLHCIWTLPDGDTDFSTRWALIKQSVSRFSPGIALPSHTRSTSARKHRESTIWQRRFWEHMIRDDTDFERHLDYIHFNPVRHGYVGRAVDWPYSTIHRYIQRGVYAADWGGGADSGWGDFE